MLVKPTTDVLAKIKVVGVGGGGGNTLNTMISQFNIEGVEFIAVNTDAQALKNSLAPIQLQIGQELTRGLGVGGDPDLGAKSAEESIDAIHEQLAGADMVFLTCGMGGGTGTGATPVIASIAKNLGALTVAVVTKPFQFEGKRRMESALKGIEDLKDKVDTLIVIPNQRLLDIIDKNISFLDAMRQVDEVLSQGVKSISNLVTKTGLINVDFADVKTIMTNSGSAMMGLGHASGENRATAAAKAAISSPLLEMSIDGATGVLLNVTGGLDMTMKEVDEAAEMITQMVDPSANIIFGAVVDEDVKDELHITVLATGFGANLQVVPTARVRQVTPATAKDDDDVRVRPQRTVTPPRRQVITPVEDTKPRIQDDVSDAGGDDELDVPAYLRRPKG